MIHEVLQGMDAMRATLGLPLSQVCAALEVPYATVRRWRSRERRGEPVVSSPGPRKMAPLRLEELSGDIRALPHRRTRSGGTGLLYRRYAAAISRRELQALVQAARQDARREERRALWRIEWHAPNVAWAMDDLECTLRDTHDQKIYVHRVQDLASRYKFLPLVGEFPCGEEIAGHLAAQFSRYGAPLLLKRDNGGNLHHPAVTAVLEEFLVFPLTSPPYYAPYNGAMEESQGEFQRGFQTKVSPADTCPREHVHAYAEAVENDLNHRPRPCLRGRSSCNVYFTEKYRHIFSLKERRMFYEWTTAVAEDILNGNGGNAPLTWECAWRIAVETWLRHKGYITVARNGKVSPYYAGQNAH